MGISVDYKVRGQLNRSASYALIVASATGETIVPVDIAPQGGTFQGFLSAEIRPEHKPFTARVEELAPGSRRRTPVSNTLPLQTSY